MHVTVTSAELFKVEIVEELFKVNNVSRKVKWFGGFVHREEVIG